jgi:renalase
MPGMAEPVVVVGAGLSGVACARELVAAGVPVRLVDRGRRIGGRMASRTFGGRPVDLGASYLTVEDDDFAEVVHDWERRGLARRWTDTFDVLVPGAAPSTTTGPLRWGAPGGLRTLVEDLAADLEVEQVELDALPTARVVVLAMPDLQAARLLDHGEPLRDRLDRVSDPVLALAARWTERRWDLDGAFVNDHDVLAWIADDGRRKGDGAPVVVAHSTPSFARPHLADPSSALGPMVAALRGLLHLDEPEEAFVHRWSQARPVGDRAQRYLLERRRDGGWLGVCGDGWGPTPKVETAWRSGRDLGRAVAGLND